MVKSARVLLLLQLRLRLLLLLVLSQVSIFSPNVARGRPNVVPDRLHFDLDVHLVVVVVLEQIKNQLEAMGRTIQEEKEEVR